jgi:hypothetical protein
MVKANDIKQLSLTTVGSDFASDFEICCFFTWMPTIQVDGVFFNISVKIYIIKL